MTAVANKSKRPPTAQQVADRRQRVAEMLAQEKARERQRKVIFGGGGGVIAAALVVVLILVATHKSTPKAVTPGDPTAETIPAAVTASDGATTTEPAAVKATDDSGITGVQAYNSTGWPASVNDGPKESAIPHGHVAGPVTYSVTPPVGGDHNATWMNCGVYAQPVPNERAVHNLEHGAVWITYKSSLPAADVDALRAFVLKQATVKIQGTDTKERYIDLTPWKDDSLPSPIVISSWAHQLQLTSATDPRLQQFVDTFRVNPKYTPEYGSACNGVDPSVGGKPFEGA